MINPFSTQNASMSAKAFHEKAGRSQVGSFVFFVGHDFSVLPSRHCRHPSIRTLCERSSVRSVQVGRSRFSRCCYLIVDLSFSLQRNWARRLTQSPELGLWTWSFLSQNVFAFMPLPAWPCGRCCVTVRTLLHSPLPHDRNITQISNRTCAKVPEPASPERRASLINGVFFSGAQPEENFARIIDEELTRKHSSPTRVNHIFGACLHATLSHQTQILTSVIGTQEYLYV